MMISMTIDILIVSYAKDLEWFRWSTAILEKNLTGYRRIVAVVPEQDAKLFKPIADERKAMSLVPIKDWPGQGYYWQQNVKVNADQFTDADCIAHIDSDVFVKEPTDVSAFFVDNKPAWLWQFYSAE